MKKETFYNTDLRGILKSKRTTSPYRLSVTNKSNKHEDCVIFGHDKNIDKPNFGNSENIILENISSNESTYPQMIREVSNRHYYFCELPDSNKSIGIVKITMKNLNNDLYLNIEEVKSLIMYSVACSANGQHAEMGIWFKDYPIETMEEGGFCIYLPINQKIIPMNGFRINLPPFSNFIFDFFFFVD